MAFFLQFTIMIMIILINNNIILEECTNLQGSMPISYLSHSFRDYFSFGRKTRATNRSTQRRWQRHDGDHSPRARKYIIILIIQSDYILSWSGQYLQRLGNAYFNFGTVNTSYFSFVFSNTCLDQDKRIIYHHARFFFPAESNIKFG